MKFLEYAYDGYWDFPKKPKAEIIDVKYVFMGPCTPSETSTKGYKFAEDERAIQVHNSIKRKK